MCMSCCVRRVAPAVKRRSAAPRACRWRPPLGRACSARRGARRCVLGRVEAQHAPQDLVFQRGERRVAVRARPRQRHRLVERDRVVFDQDHAVSQRHGFGHVVRDQQRGEAVLLPQRFDQAVHLDARERVERAQRLVEQQQARPVHQRARQRHALPLAARQHRRPIVRTVAQPHLLERLHRAHERASGGQAERHVVDHALPRQQARILEHDADVGALCLDRCAVECQCAGAGLLERGEQAQQRALAAAAAAHHRDERTRLDRQVDAVEHAAFAEPLAQPARLHAEPRHTRGLACGRLSVHRVARGNGARCRAGHPGPVRRRRFHSCAWCPS